MSISITISKRDLLYFNGMSVIFKLSLPKKESKSLVQILKDSVIENHVADVPCIDGEIYIQSDEERQSADADEEIKE